MPINENVEQRFRRWLQVTAEDNFAVFLYMPILVSLALAGVCYLGLIDVSPIAFLLSAGLLVASWLVVALNNARFVRHAFPAHGVVGPKGRSFRRYVNHTISYEINGRRFDTPHSFLKGEVKEGEDILLLVHQEKHRRIRILQRAQDKNSILAD